MNAQEYLADVFSNLDELVHDERFLNQLSQVRARAIQEEYVYGRTATRFTFDSRKIWKYCDYILSESTLLLREGFEDRELLLRNVRLAAQAFEFLARFADAADRWTLLLSSAMCYYISGYQANALCMTRLIDTEISKSPDAGMELDQLEDFDQVLAHRFQQTLLKFLYRDIVGLQEASVASLSFIRGIQETITAGVSGGTLGIGSIYQTTAHAHFHQSMARFAQYCVDGNRQDVVDSGKSLEKSHRYFERTGDVAFATITSELRAILETSYERGTWANIREHAETFSQDRMWRFYLRNLALERSIVEFWPSQLKAVRNGLLKSNDSFVVQMPTSAGKTFIAELAILAALTTYPQSRCLYIAPYRALVSEIEASLSETLGAVGYQVSTLIGGFEFDSFQEFLVTQSDVLIATPEKVELLLRTHPDYFEALSTVIIDEGHIIDEGIPAESEITPGKTLAEELGEQGGLGRGIGLEFLITRLKQRFSVRFIYMSAVMPDINSSDFVTWLCEQPSVPLRIGMAERPSRQVIGKFEWISAQNGELEYISLPPIPPDDRRPFVHSFLQRKRYLTGEKTPTGKNQRESWPDIDNKSQTTGLLAARMSKSGPVLIFCAQRSHVINVTDNLVKSLKFLESSGELPHNKLRYVDEPTLESYYQSVEWFGPEDPLTNALRRGVALHYGPLPDPVRRAIEKDFRDGKIQILVSTNTLGQGVNLPIKTAVIYSLERSWYEVGARNTQVRRTSKLKKRDFWNICGRAGRAGKETEGQIVFVVSSASDRALLGEYVDRENIEDIESGLYRLLVALIERRISQSELIGFFDPQVLALLAEEIVDTEDEEAISGFLNRSLVGIQAAKNGMDSSRLAAAITFVSRWITTNVPDTDKQKIYASTGFRVTSCQLLDQAVSEFMPRAAEELALAGEQQTKCSDFFILTAFRACANLPEMQLARKKLGPGPEEEYPLLSGWLEGMAVQTLKSKYWNPNEGEKFGEYMTDRVIYKLPWGINGFLRLLAHQLRLDFNGLPLAWQHLPAMFKFGVNDAVACWLCSLGVTSRNIALQLADRFIAERAGSALDFSDLAKWFLNLPNGYIFTELDARRLELEQLIGVRNKVIAGRGILEALHSPIQELRSPVRGIPYEGRAASAARVTQGDSLELVPELDNPYDPYAIAVVAGGDPIGYVQRDIARIVSREMLLGREANAIAINVRQASETYPYPWIEISIVFP